jgi:hypothetical protein
MEGYQSVFLASCELDSKVGFPETTDLRGAYLHDVSRCSSVTISYQIVTGIPSFIPSQTV